MTITYRISLYDVIFLVNLLFLFIFQIETYSSKCLNACRVLARLFALALGLDKNHFDQPGNFCNHMFLHLLHQPDLTSVHFIF
jgi:hypothetical protein